MSGPKGVSAIRTAKGEWKEGRLHGRANVVYHDGSVYDGEWVDGSRKGHGCSVAGENLYVGAWLNGVYNGYGVFADALRGCTYLGMWENGIRHGPGTLVLQDGVFYTGVFVNDQMVGQGHLLTEDDTEYVGEFLGECHLQGKGTVLFHL
jgi:prepilin-type processing-associated H-X9-DG protein